MSDQYPPPPYGSGQAPNTGQPAYPPPPAAYPPPAYPPTAPTYPPPVYPPPVYPAPPPPYAQPGYPYPMGYVPVGYVPVARTSGWAIASLICPLLGGGILGVIFGHIALNEINRSGNMIQGRGMAIAGLIIGYIGIGLLIIYLIALASYHPSCYGYYC